MDRTSRAPHAKQAVPLQFLPKAVILGQLGSQVSKWVWKVTRQTGRGTMTAECLILEYKE